jgi:hypothetical protein
MKRYRLIYRGLRDAYYSFDIHTNKRESLGTNNAEEAQRLVDAKNEAVRHTEMNPQLAQAWLSARVPNPPSKPHRGSARASSSSNMAKVCAATTVKSSSDNGP